MKSKLLFLLFLPLFLSAQQYTPLITEGAFWDVGDYDHENPYSCLTGLRRYSISDDIAINGQVYKQLNIHIIDDSGIDVPCPEEPFIVQSDFVVDTVYIREDVAEKKVYIWSNRISDDENYHEYLLYDFSLNIGDQIINPYYFQDVFIANIQTDDNGVKTFITNSSYSYTEGIGGESGVVAVFEPQFEYFTDLFCHGDDNNQNECATVAGMDKFLLDNVNIYPNPVENRLTVKSITPLNITIYSVLGKEILNYTLNSSSKDINVSKLNKGIYFVRVIDFESKSEKVFKLVKN